jgi:hypothetical protein
MRGGEVSWKASRPGKHGVPEAVDKVIAVT